MFCLFINIILLLSSSFVLLRNTMFNNLYKNTVTWACSSFMYKIKINIYSSWIFTCHNVQFTFTDYNNLNAFLVFIFIFCFWTFHNLSFVVIVSCRFLCYFASVMIFIALIHFNLQILQKIKKKDFEDLTMP